MKPLHNFFAILLSLNALLAASVALPANLPPDWSKEQPFTLPNTGLVKLALPVETLNSARPGLEDLRLYDDAGNEVPYLIEHPAPVAKKFQDAKSFQVRLNANTTVINLETGAANPIDGVGLQTSSPDFIKAVDIEGSINGTDWQILARGQPVFRQTYGASQLHLSFPPGAWTWLRLTVDDRRSPPVPFTGAFVHTATDQPAPTESIPVAITERDENPGETRLALNLGAANLDIASLRIETTEPLFMRPVALAVPQISDNTIREQSIGHGTIYRVAIEGQTPSENLTVPLDSPVPSHELLVFIKNGDSPPLKISSVQVARHPVYLIFLAREPGPYHLLTGNAHCPAPRYDLAALGMNLQSMTAANVTLPSPVDNRDFHAAEILPGIGENGAPLDVSAWKCRKAVKISNPGVQQVDLDLDLMAHTVSGFADLRLLHGSNQVPYIIEHTSINRPLATMVIATNDPAKPEVSRWIIKLPQSNLPLTRLTCTTPTTLFKRSLSLYELLNNEQGDKYRHDLGQANWTRTPEHPARELTLAFDSPPQSDTLYLETANGDNPPVELNAFQVFYPVTRILFKTQSSSGLVLYYGNSQASSPDYDLSLVAGQLLSAKKNNATLSPEESLKQSSWHENAMTRQGNLLFWGALALVVIVLLAIISRLLPKSQLPQ